MKRYLFVLLLVVLSSWLPAMAGDFSVSPVHVHLSDHHKIATLIITNLQGTKLTVQASALSWRQIDGVNSYNNSVNLIISPPLFSIPPHDQQIVRVGWIGAFPKETERDLHLVFHEVPMPPKPGFTGVQLVLRMVLPVFVAPTDALAAPHLSATLHKSDKYLLVHIANSGGVHGEVTQILVYSDNDLVMTKNILGYILPHEFINVRLPLPPPAHNQRLRVMLDTIQNGRTATISATT